MQVWHGWFCLQVGQVGHGTPLTHFVGVVGGVVEAVAGVLVDAGIGVTPAGSFRPDGSGGGSTALLATGAAGVGVGVGFGFSEPNSQPKADWDFGAGVVGAIGTTSAFSVRVGAVAAN